MSIPSIIKAQPLNDYKIRLEFADGVTGEVDLSHLVGKSVFARWNNYENFKKISFEGGRWFAWSDDIDIDADTLYMKLTGKTPDEFFPILKQDLAYA